MKEGALQCGPCSSRPLRPDRLMTSSRVARLAILVAASAVASVSVVHAQGCCSAGGGAAQIGLFRQGQLYPGQATLALYYGRVQADRSYVGSEVVVDPQDRKARLRSATVAFGLGLPRGLSLQIAVPVVWRDRSFRNSFAGVTNLVEKDGSGLADPMVAMLARLTPIFGAGGWHVTTGAGVQIPIGEDEQRRNGVRLANEDQPATGAWSVSLMESVSRSSGDWLFFHHLSWTIAWKNTTGYKLGNSIRVDIGSSVLLRGPLEPYMRMDLLHTRPDQSRDRTESLSSTGGTRLYAVPGLALNLKPQRLLLSAEFGFPVFQNYSGNQLGTGRRWLLGLSYLL